MNQHSNQTQEQNSRSVADEISQNKYGSGSASLSFTNNRPETVAQRQLQQIIKQGNKTNQFKAINNSGTVDLLTQSSKQLQRNFPVKTVQRYPTAMDDDSAKTMATLYSTNYEPQEGEEEYNFTEEQLAEIKDGVFMLNDLFPSNPGMSANCIGWAQNTDDNVNPGNMYTWEQDYTAVDDEDATATIILWGEKDEKDEEDRSKWDIKHASVLLSHAEIVRRSKEYTAFEEISAEDLTEAGIADPCWTSVGGFGYGAIVHPKYWYEGGDFGTALTGMK